MRRRWPAVAGLAVALVGTAAARAEEAGPAGKDFPSIVVTGDAQRQVPPDMAVVTLGVTTERTSAQDAARGNAVSMQAVIDAAKAAGIADADLATEQATLMPVYDSPGNGQAPRIKSFRAVNSVVIQVHKLDSTGDLVGRLIDRGANSLQGVDFTVADPEPVRDALRARATTNARHRAEIYASALGLRLGRVLSIVPDGAAAEPVAMRPMLKMAAPAAVPLQAGTQTVDARVTVTWALEGQN